MLRSNSGLTELSGLTITHFLKEKLGGVEKKRKNVKYICMFMYKRAWKHLLKTYNGLLLAEGS